MLDAYDRERFSAIYRLLAEVLEHERGSDREAGHMPYLLGDLAGRLFIGTPCEPPGDILQAVADILRTGGPDDRTQLAVRLREFAEQLDKIGSPRATSPP
jgi:hypothetical protein